MPGQRPLPYARRAERAEYEPLLTPRTRDGIGSEKTGLSGGLSFWGKAWVCIACGVLPLLMVTGVYEAISHHRAVPKVQPPPQWAPPPDSKWKESAKKTASSVAEHDWADDAISAPSAPQLRAEHGWANAAWARAEETIQDLEHRLPSRAQPRQSETAEERYAKTAAATEDSSPARKPFLHSGKPRASPVQLVPAHAVQQPLVLSARCSLPLELNMICSGIVKTALRAEEAKIRTEITKHLPSWVTGVSLNYESGVLVAEPTVRLSSMPEQGLFGSDPQHRLRCTFESLMRSSKVLGATALLAKYSGGLCSASTGAATCEGATGTPTNISDCDPVGDFLIADP